MAVHGLEAPQLVVHVDPLGLRAHSQSLAQRVCHLTACPSGQHRTRFSYLT